MGTFIIEVQGVKAQVERKDIKNIRIRVKPPDGQVCISMPRRCSTERVRRFMEQELSWIEAHRKECIRKKQMVFTGTNTGDQVMLWGKMTPIYVSENTERSGVRLTNAGIMIFTKQRVDEEERIKLLDEFYRSQLSNRLSEVAEKWQAVTGIDDVEWRVRKMKSRWGTCMIGKKRIWLNLRLAMLPPECLDAVAVHELCHFFESGHNRKFYSLMDKYYPDWHYADVRLKELSGVLQ